MKKLFFGFSLLLLLFSCEETTSTNTTNTISPGTPSSAVSSTPLAADSTATDDQVELLGKPLDYVKLNEEIKVSSEAKEEWVLSPLSIMLRFTGANMDSKIKSIRSKQLGPGESLENVIVTVEEDGLMDDSVSGTMTVLRMKKEEGIWQVYKASRAWKCWKGRGHQTYSGKPCG